MWQFAGDRTGITNSGAEPDAVELHREPASLPASWTASDKRTVMTPPIVSATVSGDTLTLTLDQGTPAFAVTPQSTHFTETTGLGGPPSSDTPVRCCLNVRDHGFHPIGKQHPAEGG